MEEKNTSFEQNIKDHDDKADSRNAPTIGYSPENDILNIPDGIKVDINTPMELAINFLTMISGASTLLLLNLYFRSSRGSFATYASLAAVLFFVFLMTRYDTDNYYIIENGTGDIYYFYKFLDKKTVTLYKKACDIKTITVGGISDVNNGNIARWSYIILLADKKGNTTGFGFWKYGDEGLKLLNEEAEKYAGSVGCEFIPGRPRCAAMISFKNNEAFVEHIPKNPPMFKRLAWPSSYGYMIYLELFVLLTITAGTTYVFFFVTACPNIRRTLLMIFVVITIIFNRRYIAG